MAFGTGALANLGVAGSGLVALPAGEGIGRLQFLLACAAVLVGSVVLVFLTPSGDGPFVAFAFASAIGMLLTFVAILAEMRPAETAAVCSPLALGALAFLPGLATRFARLPIGFDPPRTVVGSDYDDADDGDGQGAEASAVIDAERIAAQARRGHELLLGLVGGCALVVRASAVLGFSDDLWAQLLALATGLALLTRAHLFRPTAQVACTLAAGLASLVLLGLGLCINPPGRMVLEALRGDSTALDIRLVWLSVAVAVVAGAIAAIALVVPSKGVTPFWGRFLEIAESSVLLTLLPLCLAVFGAYQQIQAAQQGLDQEAATQVVTQTTGPMNTELGQLRKLREEAAAWQRENEAAERRARDLRALAERARTQMPSMNDEDRADAIDLIDVKVTLQSPVPVRKGRSSCAVGAWFKERILLIPVEVPDAAWAVIQPFVTKTGRGSGKSTDLPVRDAVEAILWKARTAKAWNEAASRMTRGVGKSLMSRWTRWNADGTWEHVVETLAEVEGIQAVPVPEPSKEPPLPEMLVEGVVDPRLFHTGDGDVEDGETRGGTVASSATMSWQAAMTASAMPGCPSRRAAPGFCSLIN